MIEWIDRYLTGQMSADEKADFENYRKSHPEIESDITAFRQLQESLGHYGERNALQQNLSAVMNQQHQNQEGGVLVHLWRSYRKVAAVAASVALVTSLITYWGTSYTYKKQTAGYTLLRRELETIKKSQNALIRNINTAKQEADAAATTSVAPVNPGNFGGTGFAITSNGYIVTNYHVVEGSDSVYVENNKGLIEKATVVTYSQEADLAILKIVRKDFHFPKGTSPIQLTEGKAALGQQVFTMGYPKDEIVYNEGYISSKNGFNSDTMAYQLELPVNPGNSGAPVIDKTGRLVGIIAGKQSTSEGISFAIKSKELMKLLNKLPKDFNRKELSKSSINGIGREDQVKKLEEYILLVKVYN